MILKKLFSLKYNDKVLLEVSSNRLGISSTAIAILIVIYTLQGQIPSFYLAIWFFTQMFIFVLRLYFAHRLKNAIKYSSEKKEINLYLYMASIILSGFVFSTISLSFAVYNVPDINIFIVGVLVIALAAGSIGTLVSIYVLFASFVVTISFPFLLALLYQGDVFLYIFAFVLFIFMIAHCLSGYRLYLSHQKVIYLEEKFKTIYNKSSDGIVIIKNGRFFECNESIIDMFGYTNKMEEFLHTNINILMPVVQPDGTVSLRKMIRLLFKAEKKICTFEWLHLKKDGSTFWVEITLSPIILNQEKVVHGIWRDISDRKKSESKIVELNTTLEDRIKQEIFKNRHKDQQLMQQSRLAQMGEMISMIAHQWRQPLAAIGSTSASLELKTRLGKIDDASIIDGASNISGYVQHLSTTINVFRDFFKEDKERKETSYSEILQSISDIIGISLKNKNILLIKESHTEKRFYTYPNELKQVVLNLIKNAEDVLSDNKISTPYIKIIAYSEGDAEILEVHDNGGGVPEDIIENIFDPYFSTKLNKNGTGLGLYMSKTIISKHCSGKLSVFNNENGAVFKIVLNTNEG